MRIANRWHFFAVFLIGRNSSAQVLPPCGRQVQIGTTWCMPEEPATYGDIVDCDGVFRGSGNLCWLSPPQCTSTTMCNDPTVVNNALFPPRDCSECAPTERPQFCTNCEHPRRQHSSEPECTRPSCRCERARGAPVTVGTGQHTLVPIQAISVPGPWTIPLEFTVYYSQENPWTSLFDEASNPRVTEGNFLGKGWSHTLSEAVVITERVSVNGVTKELRVPPQRAGLNWGAIACIPSYPNNQGGHLENTGPGNTLPFRRIYYRLPWGEMHEFYTVAGGAVGTDSCADMGGGVLRLANHRGSPYRLELMRAGAALTGFRVTDLATGVRSEFDTFGRIIAKKAPVPGGNFFGWSAAYSASPSGPFTAITHDSGSRIVHNPIGGFFGTLHLFGPSEVGALANPSNEWVRFNDPLNVLPGQPSPPNLLLRKIIQTRTGNSWNIEYREGQTLVFNGVTRTTEDIETVLRVRAMPSNIVTEFAGHQGLNACAPGGVFVPRARSAEDPTGTFEFRRQGTSMGEGSICASGAAPVPDATRGFNPCAAAGTDRYAVLDLRQIARNAAGDLTTCTYNANDAGGCNTTAGFTCSQRTIQTSNGPKNVCVRFVCQSGGYDEVGSFNPDETTTIVASDGCGSSTNFWASFPLEAGAAQRQRRLESRIDAQGIRTSYAYDSFGRMVARCIGDDATINANGLHLFGVSWAAGCPADATFESWTYGDDAFAIHNSWAISKHMRRGFARGATNNPTWLVENYNYAPTGSPNPFLLESIVQSGDTLTTVTGASLTYGAQERFTNFTYHPVSGAIASLTSAVAGDSTGYETVFTYFSAADGTDNRLRLSTLSARAEAPGQAPRSLTTTYSNYSKEGIALTQLSPTGITTTVGIDATTRRPLTVTSAGRTSSYSYTTDGRLRSVTLPTGQGIFFEYTAGFPDPAKVHITDYPAWLDPIGGMPNASLVLARTMDPFSITRQSDVLEHHNGAADITRFSSVARRDDHARLGEIPNPANAFERGSITYDTQNRVTSTKDTEGHETRYTYDAMSRVVSVNRGSDTGAGFSSTQFITIDYQTGSDLATAVHYHGLNGEESQGISYRYNDFGEMVESDSSDIGKKRFQYDRHGRLVAQLENDNSPTLFEYDRAGRVVRIDRASDGMGPQQFADDQQFFWDVLPFGFACPAVGDCTNLTGRLAAVDSGWVGGVFRTFYGYTVQGQVRHETLSSPGQGVFRTGYQYDAAGRLTDIVYPFGTGDSAHYLYSGIGDADDHQVSRLENYWNGAFWHSLVKRVDRVGGVISSMWYNQDGEGAIGVTPSVRRNYRVDGRLGTAEWRSTNAGPANIGDFYYTYRNSGQIAGIANNLFGADQFPGTYFRYDDEGRLTCVTSDNSDATCADPLPNAARIARYTYDSRGNRKTSEVTALENSAVNFSYPSGFSHPMRLNEWYRSGWDSSHGMNVWYGYSMLGYGGPGQRMYEYRNANGPAEPYVYRYTNYYASGRPAWMGIQDSAYYRTNTFGYDHNGRRRARVRTRYDGQTITELFFYDLAGRNLGVATWTTLSGVTHTRAEPIFWVDQEPVARYVFNDNAFSEIDFMYNDHTGTPRAAVRVATNFTNPQVTYRASTEPFLAGPPLTRPENSGAEPVRMRFPGQWEDVGTDMQFAGGSVTPSMGPLVANHARMYEPGFAGYTQAEPLLGYGRIAGVEGITPWFGYAGYRPQEMVDPDGRFVPWVVSAALFGAAIEWGGLTALGTAAGIAATWAINKGLQAFGAATAIGSGVGIVSTIDRHYVRPGSRTDWDGYLGDAAAQGRRGWDARNPNQHPQQFHVMNWATSHLAAARSQPGMGQDCNLAAAEHYASAYADVGDFRDAWYTTPLGVGQALIQPTLETGNLILKSVPFVSRMWRANPNDPGVGFSTLVIDAGSQGAMAGLFGRARY